MHIERLSPDDWQRLRTLRLRALADAPDAYGTTLAEARSWAAGVWRRQAAGLPTFIAVRDHRDVGIVRADRDYQTPDAAFLLSMWVAPEARGRGVGDALVGALLGWATGLGLSRVLLDVGDDNAHAIALYARHGFQPTGRTGRLDPPRQHVREHQRVRELA